ncbi:MAG: Uma2 family endonuclease, partial [Planctomycetes bacterium]|nr:Uma2 family endonuclease [Planctomycetota bacterium]
AGGILSENARVELLDGKVVNKMARNPPHDTSLSLTHDELEAALPAEWYLRVQMAVVLGKTSQPEPDIAVVLAPIKRYLKQHPVQKDIGMLVEVADSSLLQDRRDKAPIYAAGRIPWFWTVNVADKIVEVYSDPKGGGSPVYRKRHDYKMGDKVPVVLNGKTMGNVEVSKLFPDDAE